MTITKKINLQLVGLDGNAFALMGSFQCQARKEKWTKEEIDFVLKEAMSGDYNNLIATLDSYCEPQDDEYENDW